MYKPKYDSPKTYYLHVKCYQCLRIFFLRSKFDSIFYQNLEIIFKAWQSCKNYTTVNNQNSWLKANVEYLNSFHEF